MLRLEYHGVRGVAKDWFISSLSNRHQYVSLGNATSNLLPILCCAPQSSVLGPLLFLLYINDLSKYSDIFDFHLFAYDASLFL